MSKFKIQGGAKARCPPFNAHDCGIISLKVIENFYVNKAGSMGGLHFFEIQSIFCNAERSTFNGHEQIVIA